MASEPKSKHSKSHKRTRRAAITLNAAKLLACSNCGQKVLSHQACKSCGYYAGKKVSEKAIITRA